MRSGGSVSSAASSSSVDRRALAQPAEQPRLGRARGRAPRPRDQLARRGASAFSPRDDRAEDALELVVASSRRAAMRSSRRPPRRAPSARSGTSRSSQVSRNASDRDRRSRRGTPAAAPAANASTYGAWTARRQVLDDRGVRRRRDVHARAAGARRARGASRFAKIAPNTDTPIEPPIWRKSVEPEVATPRQLVVDRVLGGEHEHLHHHPEPEAEHEHVDAPRVQIGVDDAEPREQEQRDASSAPCRRSGTAGSGRTCGSACR